MKEKKRISGIWIVFLVIIVVVCVFLVMKFTKKENVSNENKIDENISDSNNIDNNVANNEGKNSNNVTENTEKNDTTKKEESNNTSNNSNNNNASSNSNTNNQTSGFTETTDTSKFYMGGNAGGIDINKLDNAKVDNGEKVNVSSALSQDKEFDGLKFTHIQVKSNMGSTEFIAIVKNISGKETKSRNVKVKFMNKDGSEMGSLVAYIPDLKVNEEREVDSSITEDYVNAYSLKFVNP